MSPAKFLAFDFGAENGRAILGTLDKKTLKLEEIHRFSNRQILESGHIHWDIQYLINELKRGLTASAQRGHRELQGVGIDTWGVDFGLIGKNNQILENPFAYRDSRTEGMMERAFQMMSKEEMYSLSGIQFMPFNSVFQLLSLVETKSPVLRDCETLLFMPDIFNFLLTGQKYSEYTITSTSQLLNAEKKEWEPEVFRRLGLPLTIMAPIIQPGTVVGRLLEDIVSETGVLATDVIAPACHDTASAVAAVPAQSENWAYLSSGTWSLLGVEVQKPIINKDSFQSNFTNEGGISGTIRFLRNTMGLWLLQRCLKDWRKEGESVSYEELDELTSEAEAFKRIIDPDDLLFLNPPHMPEAISEFCRKTDQPLPKKKPEFIRCIFESLAMKYCFLLDKIETIRKEPVDVLHVVGGGTQNEVLNQFSANATGLPVLAGPVEATAAGNIIIQAMAKKEIEDVDEGRETIARSFSLKHYEPQDRDQWNEAYQRVKYLFS